MNEEIQHEAEIDRCRQRREQLGYIEVERLANLYAQAQALCHKLATGPRDERGSDLLLKAEARRERRGRLLWI